MPPKKKNSSKSQEDDKLDQLFEKKQALLAKKEATEDQNQDDQTDQKQNNIFQNIQSVDLKQKKKNVLEPKPQQGQKQKATEQKQEVAQKSKATKKQIKKEEDQEEEQEDDKEIVEEMHAYHNEQYVSSDEDMSVESDDEREERLRKQKREEELKNEKKKAKTEKKDKKDKKEEKNAQSNSQAPQNDQELFKESHNHCDYRIVIFLVISLVLMFTFKYYGDNFNRYRYTESAQNLYSVLEIESSATPQEVKTAFRKLSQIWHPDKNENCGNVCKEKFYAINEAWKVLGNAKSRDNYDSSHGMLEMIKSKAVSLTGENYDSLVLQSTDVWIIQVYMNGNGACSRMSPFWENTIDTYGHVVKFGRIDAEKDIRLVHRLPFPTSVFPTFFTISHHSAPALISFDSHNIGAELAKSIQKAVINKINIVKKEQAEQVAMNAKSYAPNKPIDIIYLFSSDKIPIEYKYAALQNWKEFNFYTNGYNQNQAFQKALGTKNNFLVFINDEEKKVRNKYEFNFGNSFNPEKFDKIMSYLKFKITPELSKENFKHYCRRSEEHEYASFESEEDSRDYQTLCVILFSQSPIFEKLQTHVQQFRSQLEAEQVQKFQQGQRIFENYHSIQFAVVDLNRQWRFRQVLEAFVKDNHPTDQGKKQLHAIAFLEENKKIAFLKSEHEFEDWLLDLEDQSIDFEYLTSHLSDEKDVSSLFQFDQDTPLKMMLRSLKANAIDFKMIITVFLGFLVLLFKFNAQTGLIWTSGLYFTSIIGLAVLETYQDFLYSS